MAKPHSEVSLGARHSLHNWEDPDIATRNARTYTDDDIGKTAKVASPLGYWLLVSQTGGVGSFWPAHGVVQELFSEITTDVSTTDATPPGPDLFSESFTILAGSTVRVWFHAAGTDSQGGSGPAFKIRADGTLYKGVGAFMATANGTWNVSAFVDITGLAAGARTISVEWYKFAAGGSLAISAASIEYHGASLLIQEIRP